MPLAAPSRSRAPPEIDGEAGAGIGGAIAGDAVRIGAGAVEDRGRHVGGMIDPVGLSEPAGFAQGEVVRIGAAEGNAFDTGGGRAVGGGQPGGDIGLVRERIERTAGGERGIERMAAGTGIGKAAADRGTRGVECGGERAERRGQQRLDAAAERLDEPGRGAAGADRDQHRIAIDDRGEGEVAEVRAIDGVDQGAGRAKAGDGGLGLGLVLDCDDGERAFAADERAGTFEQAALGIGRGAGADQRDGAAGKANEDGQAVRGPSSSR